MGIHGECETRVERAAVYTLCEFGVHYCMASLFFLPQSSLRTNYMQIRIFFRLIEFSGGKTSSNPLPYHEAYFYVLEAVPMCFAILCYNMTHPGIVLQGPEAQLPTIRSLVFKKGRARKTPVAVGGSDGEELVSHYAELGDEPLGKYIELEGKDPREGRRSFRQKFGLW
jgi:hypothetical protein